jgi:hypothetical protein
VGLRDRPNEALDVHSVGEIDVASVVFIINAIYYATVKCGVERLRII